MHLAFGTSQIFACSLQVLNDLTQAMYSSESGSRDVIYICVCASGSATDLHARLGQLLCMHVAERQDTYCSVCCSQPYPLQLLLQDELRFVFWHQQKLSGIKPCCTCRAQASQLRLDSDRHQQSD